MNTLTFRAMNTDWWIGTPDDLDLAPCEATVHEAERRYSRFRPDSLLSRLNRERRMQDAGLADLVTRALEVGVATGGAFDPRVGSALTAAGYDRTFEVLRARGGAPLAFAPPVAGLHVEVKRGIVRLTGTGTLDLGGIAKGWTVDRVAEQLEAAGCTDYLVDGGGDIRVAGRDERGEPWVVGAGDGLAVSLESGAVCTSSTRRRRWPARGEDAHHIIDPERGAPSRHAVMDAVVVAVDAATADALATALIAQPARSLAALPALEAEALLLRDAGWEMTEGMRQWLV
ncbi:MAG: FAD:protein FMN transferase [Dehalococcoidia bacterium]